MHKERAPSRGRPYSLGPVKEPIRTYEGKILDGRNRFRACQRASVAPRFEQFVGDDPIAYVRSLNLCRRHLDSTGCGVAAAKMMKLYRELAAKRLAEGQKRGGEVGGGDQKSADRLPRTRTGEPISERGTEAVADAAKDFGVGAALVQRVIRAERFMA